MKTPIADFIDGYIKSNTVRFHMPGHKGVGHIEQYDITEISGADVLYSAEGIIEESENNVSALFGTAHTFYSAEGSTLAIKAMLTLVSKGKSKTILAARNVHKAFIYGCALLDLRVEWLYPESFSHLCACDISAKRVKEKLFEMVEKPCAVYITSPDYLGNLANIKEIASVCKEADVPLIVDNAHGAYLKFLPTSLHPIDLGAAMCADSAHKTLPTLTGGAYLHVSKDYPEFCAGARSALSLFASTSPSYLIMRSLDLCNKYLSESIKSELERAVEQTVTVKEKLKNMGFSIIDGEPLKIVIDAKSKGYSGEDIANILRESFIESEFCDEDVCVLMPSTNSSEKDFERLVAKLEKVPQKEKLNTDTAEVSQRCESAMTVREAIFSEREMIPTENALNRICASPTVSCPPAIPISVSGEIIGNDQIRLFKKYGINTLEVVKEK